MAEVSLSQMLEAREQRVVIQQALLARFRVPVISFTMNIPGPTKNSPAIERAFQEGCFLLNRTLPSGAILHHESSCTDTGCQAFYVVDLDALVLKRICADIEDNTPLGRLFDMDVLTTDGTSLERSLVGGKSRDCIVCGKAGRGCASRRTHTIDQLQTAVNHIISSYFSSKDASHIADLATQCLIDEVFTTPKPGLVDRNNCGSHSDMTLSTFVASAHALTPYFCRCVEIGQKTVTLPCNETFLLLRTEGRKAEQCMYQATQGVNTHKGAIYTLGALCGTIGRCWNPERPIPSIETLLTACSQLVSASVHEDFSRISCSNCPQTTGEHLFLSSLLTGIRGEVAAGLPSVSSIGLPAYVDALSQNYTQNDAGAITLLHLIAGVADTNLHKRGGIEGSRYAAAAAADLLKTTPYPSHQQIEELDTAFIRRNLSPGGCADLLAVVYFLHALQKEYRFSKEKS